MEFYFLLYPNKTAELKSCTGRLQRAYYIVTNAPVTYTHPNQSSYLQFQNAQKCDDRERKTYEVL
jgi:hypothetical protein